jgi:hypothetical protein
MGKFDMIIGYGAVKKALAAKKLLTSADALKIKRSCNVVSVAL